MTEEEFYTTFIVAAFSVAALVVLLLLYSIPHTISVWRLFKRAKKPGWAAVVPVYNTYVQGQVAKKPRLALLINGLLVCLVVVGLLTPFAATDVQPFMIVASLLLLVFLFMSFEQLEKHFLKHFGRSKRGL